MAALRAYDGAAGSRGEAPPQRQVPAVLSGVGGSSTKFVEFV